MWTSPETSQKVSPSNSQNIILVGLAGCGKTTVGQALAQRLGWSFVDTDHLITDQTGQAVADIFSQFGEAHFRDLESGVCHDLSGKINTVIATGGGIILRAVNRECLQNLGTVFYLELSPDAIAKRLHQDVTRPLLSTSVDKATTLKQQLDAREALYKSVAHHVISAEQSVEAICEAILCCMPSDIQAAPTLQVHTHRDHTYDILIQSDPAEVHSRIDALHASALVIVTHPDIRKWHGEALASVLGSLAHWIEIPSGEASKSMEQVHRLLDDLLALRLDRRAVLVAFGGGVIGDLVGFVASIYLRGIRLIQIPTTLLAQVDSSVGGKTGVNHPRGKNLIGTFYQPEWVWINPAFLHTLPARQMRSGLAEIVKYGVISPKNLFEEIEQKATMIFDGRDYTNHTETWRRLIRRSCAIKANVVSKDEKESGLREILNFGHTVGHAIEALAGYGAYSHGEAVAIGMGIATRLAARTNTLKDHTLPLRLETLLKRLGFEMHLSLFSDAEWETTLMLDKKVRDATLRCVLPVELGNVIVKPIPVSDVLYEIQRWTREFA